MHFFGTKDIKYFVKKFLLHSPGRFKDKVFIDIPAGNGVSSEILQSIGAKTEAYDLFPGFFKLKNMECREADLSKTLPIANDHADYVLCQEGVEHLADQFHLFKEINRILKTGGAFFITTPNYSNLRSRFSYYVAESEFFHKIMPPNELDSVWFSEKNKQSVYFGHVFLTGIMKLRMLGVMAGFKIKTIHHTRVNHTALLLLFFSYPWILLINFLAYLRAVRVNKNASPEKRKEIYWELFRLGTDPSILTDCHLFIEFEKVASAEKANERIQGVYKDYTLIT